METKGCSSCSHAECRSDEDGIPFYYCAKKDEDLGLTIVRLPSCGDFQRTTRP